MKILKALLIATVVSFSSLAMLPAKAADIVATAKSAGTFETLLAAAGAAGLAEILATTKDITVFAPTDEAFKALPEGTVENLLKPENKDQLVGILNAHVVGAKIMAADIKDGEMIVDSLNPNAKLKVVKDASGVTVALTKVRHVKPRLAKASGAAKVIATDVAADNGVIHVIDAVLLP